MAKTYTPITSKFYCTKCGEEGIPVNRKKGQERKSGHLKKLYCLHCQEETNHVEIKECDNNYTYQNFKAEFDSGCFVDGNRVANILKNS